MSGWEDFAQMGELGELLRTTREAKGLTLEQVEQAIRIRSAYLQAIESEEFDKLPHLAYAKGFIHNYAVFLGVDPQKALELYQPPAKATSAPSSIVMDQPLLRTSRPWVSPLAVVAALALVGVAALWILQRNGRLSWSFGQKPTPTVTATVMQPSPTLVPTTTLVPTAQPTITPTAIPTGTTAPTLTAQVLVTVAIDIVQQPSWVQVWVDGHEMLARTLTVGTQVGWSGQERIIVRSGNAGAVHLTTNGVDLGAMGEFGKIVEREWTAVGVPTRTPASR
jgi:cytoskeleton protein RodZ